MLMPFGLSLTSCAQSRQRRLVEEASRRRVVVEAHLVAELAAEQDVGRRVEQLACQVPQRHLDAAHRPLLRVRAAVGVAVAGVQAIDLQRIFADEDLLEPMDRLPDAETGRTVRLGDAGDAGVGVDPDQRVGPRALQHHRLDVGDLDLVPVGGGELTVAREPGGNGGACQRGEKRAARGLGHSCIHAGRIIQPGARRLQTGHASPGERAHGSRPISPDAKKRQLPKQRNRGGGHATRSPIVSMD